MASLTAALLLLLLAPPAAAQTPTRTLLWASQPTFANETVLVWGSSLFGVSSCTLQAAGSSGSAPPPAVHVMAFDVSETSIKVTLPPSLPDGRYTLCVEAGACIELNAPELWWRRGDVSLTAYPHAPHTSSPWSRCAPRRTIARAGPPAPVSSLTAHAWAAR